ncbi:MAG: acetyltransferase [Gemmatimonadales bacterium]|nr:acetyltransferase [Gemmatimonadales bacterium]NIN09788.1 acetyltransferase [Gemmatimonadales bacterium]NIN48770.1 acetyltransferase [Gemmatimonadales bacterium]NIP06234.1 acetyltransferase [Gemmatimonadales bacterium]NIR02655.1 acetyltransferase [Gemmatimonadales bacterium]
MVHRPLRKLTLPAATDREYGRWLGEIEERLADPGCDRRRLCREVLFDIYYPGLGTYEDLIADPQVKPTTRAALLALDPDNVTLEPEYYHEKDDEKYVRVKPLLWLWQSFDRSPLGGGNVNVAVQFRRLLAKHIFRRCGENFKCFQFVEFSFGYNMEVGDNVVVHRHVLLDDRGGIVLGNRVSVADYANVYSHTHSLADQEDVTDAVTVLGDGVRITYHATVLAGVHVGEQAIVGAGAVLTRDAKPWHLYLGVPAKAVRIKPNAPPEISDTHEQAASA